MRDKMLSLAICMPVVRTSAEKGNIVMGFAGNSLYFDNPLVFAAAITDKVCGKAYYADSKYTKRPDRVYEYRDGEYLWRTGAKYHSSNELTHDLGVPPDYERAKVLLSEGCSQFRYFGSSCPIPYNSRYQYLAAFVGNLGRGHRVNLKDAVRAEMLTFLDDIWKTRETPENTDVPNTHCPTRCGEDEDEGGFDC